LVAIVYIFNFILCLAQVTRMPNSYEPLSKLREVSGNAFPRFVRPHELGVLVLRVKHVHGARRAALAHRLREHGRHVPRDC
jgi:hypothetical protein